MHVANSFDDDLKNNFKMILMETAKRINFAEEMNINGQKFGSMWIRTQNDKVVLINDLLLQLNKAISCSGSVEGKTNFFLLRFWRSEFGERTSVRFGLSCFSL